MAINWGLAGNSGGFQNALAQGYQMGSAMKERAAENALAQYMTNKMPSPSGGGGIVATPEQEAESQRVWSELVKRNPQAAYRIRQQEIQTEQKNFERQQDLMPSLAKLAEQATIDNWPQVRQAAAQIGVDPAQLPEAYDQGWLDQQRLILGAYAKDQEGLTGLAREIAMIHAPGTPEFDAAFKQAINGKYGTDYYDPSTGAMRRRGVFDAGAGGNMPNAAPQVGAVEDGYRFKGGNPADPSAWEPVEGGGGGNVTSNFLDGI